MTAWFSTPGTTNRFRDRPDAGRRLASRLTTYAGRADVVVLGLPRGGVPVAAEIAAALGAPLEVFLVRKIGVPGHPELAMGAVATAGIEVRHDWLIRELAVSPAAVADAVALERAELERRAQLYQGNRPMPDLHDRVAILVDDGLATGATMEAGIAALRTRGPNRIVVAAPVGARDTCRRLRAKADDLVCLLTPEPFSAVGLWYDDFSQTTDDEVRRCLRLADLRRG